MFARSGVSGALRRSTGGISWSMSRPALGSARSSASSSSDGSSSSARDPSGSWEASSDATPSGTSSSAPSSTSSASAAPASAPIHSGSKPSTGASPDSGAGTSRDASACAPAPASSFPRPAIARAVRPATSVPARTPRPTVRSGFHLNVATLSATTSTPSMIRAPIVPRRLVSGAPSVWPSHPAPTAEPEAIHTALGRMRSNPAHSRTTRIDATRLSHPPTRSPYAPTRIGTKTDDRPTKA